MHKKSLLGYLGASIFLLQVGCSSPCPETQSSPCSESQNSPSPQIKKTPAKKFISKSIDKRPNGVFYQDLEPTKAFDDARKVWDFSFSPDSSLFTTSGREGVYIWNPKTGTKISKLKDKEATADADVTSDKGLVATGAWSGPGELWDANTGEHIRLLGKKTEAVGDIDFSPDGAQVAATLDDGISSLWDTRSGKKLFTFKQGENHGFLMSIEFSKDGSRLLTYSKDAVLLWNTKTGKKVASLFARPVSVYQAKPSIDGTKIVTLSRYTDEVLDEKWNSEVNLWDIETGTLQATIPMKHKTRSAELSPDGSVLAIITMAARAEIIDVKTGDKILSSLELRGKGHGEQFEVKSAEFSPDGRTLAVGYANGIVQLWNIAAQRVQLTIKAHNGFYRAEFSPDGTQLATAGLDGAKLWNAATGKLMFSLEPNKKVTTPEKTLPTMAEVSKASMTKL